MREVTMSLSPPSRTLNAHLPTFIALFVGWFFYLFCRKTFSSTMPQLTYSAGFTKDQLGSIASTFSFSYGVSKFLGAIASDHTDLGVLFSTGLLLCGVSTFIFPFGSSALYCSFVMLLLGTFQGAGWPAIAKILKVRFPSERVGLFWSLVSCAGSIASAILPVLVAQVSLVMDWYRVYYLIGGTSIVISVIVYFAIPSGSSLNLPKSQMSSNEVKGTYIDLLFKVDLWIITWIYFFLYLLKNALSDWGQLYFIQEFGYAQPSAAFCISMLLLGGSVGNIVFGYFSDFLLKRLPESSSLRRSPSLVLSCVMFTIFFHVFIFSSSSQFAVNLMCFLLGFAVDGSVAVVGLLAMDAVPDHMTGLAHGIACAWAQVGTLVSGWPFSLMVLSYGWKNSLIALECVSAFVVLLASYLGYETLFKQNKKYE